jgi:hypothetical protein
MAKQGVMEQHPTSSYNNFFLSAFADDLRSTLPFDGRHAGVFSTPGTGSKNLKVARTSRMNRWVYFQ